MKKKLLLLAALSTAVSIAPAQTAMDIAGEMIPGINLGNTMEAGPCNWIKDKVNWETGWQPTKTSQAVIDCFRDQGFRSVRIPCAWFTHTHDDYEIDKPWLDRVQQVVDYCMNAGLYVVLNDHWDAGWVERSFDDLSEENQAEKSRIMTRLWKQIAERFCDYGHHLLFAGLNEPATGDDPQKISALIRYEQAFIDAVRASGGYNATRTLVVQGPDTNIGHTCNHFDITRLVDPAPSALMMEVHFYDPYNFVMMDQDASWGYMAYYWGEGNHVSGSHYNATWGEESWVRQQFDMMRTHFADKGIPAIIGEYSAMWRKLPEGENQDKHNQSIKLWYEVATQSAINAGCVPMNWDVNSDRSIIDRQSCKVINQYAMDGIRSGVDKAHWDFATSIGNVSTVASPSATAPMYNLQGMRVDDSYRGIVIKNGVKVMK